MLLCVTGPMAAGKNIASDILQKKYNFATIDADQIAHIAVENAKDEILNEFMPIAKKMGIDLLCKDGSLNRRALGSIVFKDKNLLQKQEKIVHPKIEKLLNDFIENNKQKDIVINATVLYKVPLIKKIDSVLYVDSFFILRFFRAKKRDSMKTFQILERFKSQRHLFAKYKDCVADTRKVWNTGTQKQLEKKIEVFVAEIRLRG